MHTCPDCGQECYCAGDIDDCEVMMPEWVYENCECCEDDPPLDCCRDVDD